MGYDPYVATWISDTDYITYRVYNKHGGGCTYPASGLTGPGYAENLYIDVTVYSDANMEVVKETYRLTGEIPVYPGD
jgi:hypothetical protein